MTLINDIRKDLEEGTPGPWRHSPWHIEEGPDGVYAPDAWLICTTSSAPNAHRIARVPEMEAALLAAEELEDRLAIFQAMDGHRPVAVNRARAAYRKATGVA